jgi:hypothetical protein
MAEPNSLEHMSQREPHCSARVAKAAYGSPRRKTSRSEHPLQQCLAPPNPRRPMESNLNAAHVDPAVPASIDHTSPPRISHEGLADAEHPTHTHTDLVTEVPILHNEEGQRRLEHLRAQRAVVPRDLEREEDRLDRVIADLEKTRR